MPIATTSSPTCTGSESPSSMVGRSGALDLEHGQVAARRGAEHLGGELLAVGEVRLDLVAPSTTWLLVTMTPSADTTKPVPAAPPLPGRRRRRWRRPRERRLSGWRRCHRVDSICVGRPHDHVAWPAVPAVLVRCRRRAPTYIPDATSAPTTPPTSPATSAWRTARAARPVVPRRRPERGGSARWRSARWRRGRRAGSAVAAQRGRAAAERAIGRLESAAAAMTGGATASGRPPAGSKVSAPRPRCSARSGRSGPGRPPAGRVESARVLRGGRRRVGSWVPYAQSHVAAGPRCVPDVAAGRDGPTAA